MKVTILVDNKTENPRCCAEWGLSMVIETNGKKILFDAGTSNMYAANADKLGVSLGDVDVAVVSHGHSDHTGGFESFVKRNQHAKIYIHEDAIRVTYSAMNGRPDHRYDPIWTDEFIEANRERLVFTSGQVKLYDNVDVVGNIPRKPGTVATETFFVEHINEDQTLSFIEDDMSHEQVIVVTENDQLYIFSGCSHIGVLSIVDYVQKLYPNKPIAAFIAGMHLFSYRGEKLDDMLDQIRALNVKTYVPLHCTGMIPLMRMKEKFKDDCIVAMAGDTLEF